jgi:hypothetical protein
MSQDNIGDSTKMWEVQDALDDAYVCLVKLYVYMDLAGRVRELSNDVVRVAHDK